MESVKWGIIGCGDVTEIKSGPGLQKAERSDLVAVMRRDGEKAADYARRHNVARHYDSADALIADAQVNAVYIATPPSSHRDLTLKCLAAGKPVLVEKPMALDQAECREMIDAADDSGCSLTIAYYRRALPRFEKLREIVQSGAIGMPCAVSVRHLQQANRVPQGDWKLDPSVNGGGLFVDMQTHALDWMTYVFGAPQSIAGDVRRYDVSKPAEDTITYLARFADITASGVCCFAASLHDEGMEIIGDSGIARMGFMRPSPVYVQTEAGIEEFDLPDPAHVHQPFIERLVAHYLDGAPNPCSGTDGMLATECVDAIYETYRSQPVAS